MSLRVRRCWERRRGGPLTLLKDAKKPIYYEYLTLK